MDGTSILVASMSVPRPRGSSQTPWQYHSRSDLHSKVACWGVLFDLLQQSSLLRRHATSGKVVLGINHELRDFQTGRKKKLDLVIARPAGKPEKEPKSFASLADEWGVVLNAHQLSRLQGLPALVEGVVGSAVLVAMEAKAAMTAHSKARPRLYDELNSSHLTIHGASRQALAVGFVMVNVSTTFVSPDLNAAPGPGAIISRHTQPRDAAGIVAKVQEIPRRTAQGQNGYDGLAIVAIDCANDGSAIGLVTAPPAPQPGEIHHYDSMITRVGTEYDTTFVNV
jgi:hypothetical protein